MFDIQKRFRTLYRPVSDAEDSEQLLEKQESHSRSNRSRTTSVLTTCAMMICIATVSAAFGAWMSQIGRLDADAFSVQHVSQYSPIEDEVGVQYSTVKFNGSLLVSNAFRLDAGPEVDAAWKSLGVDYHAARIPSSKAERSGLAQDQVKIRSEYGGGYPAHVEGLHHLHCLNLLRKSLAWNFQYYQKQGHGPFSNDANILKHHVTHCLDILRQQLMCTVDIGVLGQVWYQPPDAPLQAFVDFNTIHKCRNFDAIRQWAEEHQLPDAAPADFLEPPKSGDRIWHTVP